MKTFNRIILLLLTFTAIVGLTGLIRVSAATTINLDNASSFAVLAGSAITNTGSSVIAGDVGLSPGTALIGFPPGLISGNQEIANAVAVQAKNDLVTVYNNAAGQTPVTTVPTELGGTIKNAGTYDSADGTFGITGTLTLDAQGDPNAVFIFKTASTLVTAGASNIVLINKAQACNVFWQVSSSATLGAHSTFKGNILALSSATLTTGANVEGRVLARNGAVTLDANIINLAVCVASPVTTPIIVPTSTSTSTPTPVTTPDVVIISNSTTTPVVVSNAVSTSTPVIPKLPNAGVISSEQNIGAWQLILSLGLGATLISIYYIRKKLVVKS